MYINKIVVRTEPINSENEIWKNGLFVAQLGDINDKDSIDTLFLLHETEEVFVPVLDENGDMTGEDETQTVTRAFTVAVKHPFTRNDIINACEMAAYGLKDAMDVASFTAGLARKSRENANDPEVIEHDEFIEDVKAELDKFGILS